MLFRRSHPLIIERGREQTQKEVRNLLSFVQTERSVWCLVAPPKPRGLYLDSCIFYFVMSLRGPNLLVLNLIQ